MSTIKVSVAIADAYIDQILKVVEALRAMGMDVEQVLPSVGVVNGSIALDQVNRFYQIDGVQHIEPEQGYQLAPPESDVQ